MNAIIYNPPKVINFPSDIHGIRIKDGKEEIKFYATIMNITG